MSPYLGQFRKYWISVPFQILTRKKDFKSIPIQHFLLEWQFQSKSDYIVKVCYFALKMINSTTKLTFDFVIFHSLVEHLNFTYFGRKKQQASISQKRYCQNMTMLLGARGQNLGYFSKICSKSKKNFPTFSIMELKIRPLKSSWKIRIGIEYRRAFKRFKSNSKFINLKRI